MCGYLKYRIQAESMPCGGKLYDILWDAIKLE